MKKGYINPSERKKILIITDDLRSPTGVGKIARDIVTTTSHIFNWCSIGGAINHPEKNKRIDLSEETNKITGNSDSYVIMYPSDGYGNPNMLRDIIKMEKPDALFLITDPRYFDWLFRMENEIRKSIPITYLNIWDDLPAPLYNTAYYESCDLLMAISKQTLLINNLCLGEKIKNKIISYVPHGVNENIFKPLPKESLNDIKKSIFGNHEKDFVLFFNSRNIRRKQIPDTMFAFKIFLDTLPKEKAEKCALLLHTDIINEHGTDLIAVKNALFSDEYPNAVYFSSNRITEEKLNELYNISDAQILLSNNEGWGLSLTEAILSGTPIIANVTGGMQDQMGFVDEKGNWYTNSPEVPSNHTKKYTQCGEWAFPVFPTNRSMQGSVSTPYIWDDRCNAEDAAKQIEAVYNLDKETREKIGLKGREWAISEEIGFTTEIMCSRVVENLNILFENWSPREKFSIVNANEIPKQKLNHNLVY